MRIFKEMNTSGKDVCPICKTNDKKEVVLITKVGTGDGSGKKFQNYEAVQVHLDCLELWYDEKMGIIYQKIKKEVI